MRQLRRILVSVFGYIFPRSCLPTFSRHADNYRSDDLLAYLLMCSAIFHRSSLPPFLMHADNYRSYSHIRISPVTCGRGYDLLCFARDTTSGYHWLIAVYQVPRSFLFYVCSVSSVVFTIDVIHRYFNARTRAYYLAAISLVGLHIFNLQKFISLLQITINHVQ